MNEITCPPEPEVEDAQIAGILCGGAFATLFWIGILAMVLNEQRTRDRNR